MLEDKTEEGIFEICPLKDYCVNGARASDIEICEGIKGDYKNCGTYQHYWAEDIAHHNPPITIINSDLS